MKLSALYAIGVLTACGCATTNPPAYTGVRWRPDVLLALADIQEEFTRETAWCLLGKVEGGTVIVEGMAPPIVTNRTEESATFDCGAWEPIGYAHNHPRQPGPHCAPSITDVESLHNLRLALLLVSCEGGVFTYRFRGENETYRIEPALYGWAPTR